ncbi:unnamed protein product (macronuclear) [Paramecium tetraurelia]|uniref:Uncharacterized protein n=1 Tax=Paramecium tetraurelia TaxID=5888 RepID=A0BQH2_PARTE|nr:uncharacterized protein GSPATT00031018001 [Paramecium tetraurelia]CAK60789.1 unnamed protein product [Paramecium tetraurelia]|eukprot:XP_001428187.1 hypothetical protein (macronuclear) [Paramecium tetraurelia strain d4-2]
MSFFINLPQSTIRALSIGIFVNQELDFQIQEVSPKIKLIRSRAFTFNKSNLKKNSYTISPRSNLRSPKIILKPIAHDFQFFKLQSCLNDSPILDKKLPKCTPKKQFKLQPTIDFSVSGFETTDVEMEDFLLSSYVKKQ